LEGWASATKEPFAVRFGALRQLPKDFVGERHVVIVTRLPSDTSGSEWYEFEERARGGYA
jgi:hypothetical protein